MNYLTTIDAAKANFAPKISDEDKKKRHIVAIYNATDAIYLDAAMRLWLPLSKLHTLLRTSPSYAKTWYDLELENKHKASSNGLEWVVLSEVLAELARRFTESASTRQQENIEFVSNLIKGLYKNSDFVRLKSIFFERRNDSIKRLKSIRISKLDLKECELSGRPLDDGADFAHILGKALRPDLSTFWWNGLVVISEIHTDLTKRGIVDADGLIDYCVKNNFPSDWYLRFQAELEIYNEAKVCFKFVENVSKLTC
jgi:hypothetical protein